MNEYQDVPPQPGHENPAPESAKFFQWLRSLGIRRGSNRWVGGVCSGLGEKWGIDPVIVRGLAVVLTLFFGVGLLAYGVAWALLPEPDGRIHVEEVARGRWSTGMTGAGVLTLLGMIGPGQGFVFGRGDGWFPWPLLWIGGVGALVYWLVESNKSGRRGHPAATMQGTAPAPGAGAPEPSPMPGAASATGAPLLFTPSSGHEAPPLHDFAASQPYGHEPFAPNARQYTKPRPVKTVPRLGAAAGWLILGMAAIVGAVVLLLDASGMLDFNGKAASVAAAAAAITAGAGILLAGLLGRSASGLGTFAIIALVASAVMGLPASTSPVTGMSKLTWSPTSASSAEVGRSIVMGSATFDFTELGASGPLKSDVTVPLKSVASSVAITVPDSIPVTIKGSLVASSLTVNGQDTGGGLAQGTNLTLNSGAKGHTLIIVMDSAAGSVDITTSTVTPASTGGQP